MVRQVGSAILPVPQIFWIETFPDRLMEVAFFRSEETMLKRA